MDWLTQLLGFRVTTSELFQEGFVTGLAAGLLLVLLVCLVLAIVRGRRRCRGVTIPGDDGSLFVTVNAVREFVARVLCDFSETALHGVELQRHGTDLTLILDLEVLPDTAVLPLAERLRAQLIEEAGTKIGIRTGLRIDLVVRSLTARQDKIAKQTRRAVSAKLPPLPEASDD